MRVVIMLWTIYPLWSWVTYLPDRRYAYFIWIKLRPAKEERNYSLKVPLMIVHYFYGFQCKDSKKTRTKDINVFLFLNS